MAAVYVSNIVVNAGSTFSQTFELAESDDSAPLNLSGFTMNYLLTNCFSFIPCKNKSDVKSE